MAWQPTIYSVAGFGAAVVSAVVAVGAWRHREERGARPFTALMLALGGWSLTYAVQLGFTTRAGQLLWQRTALAIAGTIPTLWLLFTVRYAGKDDWLTRRRGALLAVDPLLFGLLVLTNSLHGLVWGEATLVSAAAGPILAISFGPGYYAHIAYAYLLVAAGLGVLGLVLARLSPVYRRQTGVLILGTLPPFGANIAFTVGATWGSPPTVDLTPFAFAITGVLFGLALFQFDLLERAPIAREHVLDEMGDGLIVVDTDGETVDANAVARRAFDPPPAVGRPITDVGPDGVETADGVLEALDGRTVTATVDGRERAYDVDRSPLTDHQGETVGHVLALRDVTERNEYEQRLEVAQRVLRHNLRNDMSVIREYASEFAETAADGEAAPARRIVETADELIDLSEKTRTMVRMEGSAGVEPTAHDACDLVTGLVGEFRSEHPEATIECDLPETAGIELPGAEFLEVPLRNLIENAIEHNDAGDPWVRISVGCAGGTVGIHVEDNSPAIPTMERAALEDGTEEPLRHGSGVGLWLADWSVTAAGGTISFDTREPRGNVVTLEFPAAERAAP